MKRTYLLKNLCCPNCAAKMENKIAKLKGVYEVSINFLTTKMLLELDDTMGEDLLSKIEKVIQKIESQVVLQRIG